MSDWPLVPLEDAARIRGGATPRREAPAYWNGSIPWLTPSDLPPVGAGVARVEKTADCITEEGLQSCSAQLLPPGTVLFSSRATIGKVGVAAAPLATNQGFANLIPREGVDSRYLAWCLSAHTDQIAGLAGTTTFKEVPKSALRSFRIPLPKPPEQRHIVRVLDRADRLRSLRADASAVLEELLPAVFIRTLGDPATNSRGWEARTIGDVCQVVSGATPKTNRDEYWGGSVPWATPKDLSNLDDWILDRTSRTITDAGLESCSATMLPEDSVLLSSRAPIGLVAISGIPVCTNQGFKSLVCGPEIDPWYLFAWCKLRTRFLQSLGHGATFREVSKRIVEAVEIPLPPMAHQASFRARLEELHKVRRQSREARARTSALFEQLLARAFSGSLTPPEATDSARTAGVEEPRSEQVTPNPPRLPELQIDREVHGC